MTVSAAIDAFGSTSMKEAEATGSLAPDSSAVKSKWHNMPVDD